MRKKFFTALSVFILSIGISAVSAKAVPAFQLEINNEPYDYNNEPFMLDDSIFLPLREVSEKLGYEVKWNDDKSIDLIKDNEAIKIQENSKDVVSKETGSMLNAPVIKNGRTYASIDFFSDYLNTIVALSSGNRIISIDEKKSVTEEFFSESKDEGLKTKLKEFMEIYTENQNFQGSVLVAKNNEILLDEGFGYSNAQLKIKNDSQTKFALGSMTKQFVSTGIVQLEENGLLRFDDTVNKYVDGLKYGDKITIHNLLTHTSGLVNVSDLPEFYALSDASPKDVIDLVKDSDMIFNPGEQFLYNNTNYILLGMILENVSGETMEDYFQNHFFNPLGMKDTGIVYGKKTTHIATPYQGYIEIYEVDDKPLLANIYGAGSIYSTVEDMYRWNKALGEDKLLSKESKEKLFTGYESMGGNLSYAYGWMVGENENGKYYMHDGSTLGFSSVSYKNIADDTTIIILANRRMQDVGGMCTYLQYILAENDVDYNQIPKLPSEINMDKDEFEKYAGQYTVYNAMTMDDMAMNVFAEEDKFFLQVDEQDKIQIYPEGNDKFFMKLLDAHMVFGLNEDGISDKITFTQMGMDFKGYKEGHEPEEVAIDEDTLSKYAGIYELEKDFDLDITLEDGTLYVTPTGQVKIMLKPVSKTKFELMLVDASIDFNIDENGEIHNLFYKQGEYESMAKRK